MSQLNPQFDNDPNPNNSLNVICFNFLGSFSSSLDQPIRVICYLPQKLAPPNYPAFPITSSSAAFSSSTAFLNTSPPVAPLPSAASPNTSSTGVFSTPGGSSGLQKAEASKKRQARAGISSSAAPKTFMVTNDFRLRKWYSLNRTGFRSLLKYEKIHVQNSKGKVIGKLLRGICKKNNKDSFCIVEHESKAQYAQDQTQSPEYKIAQGYEIFDEDVSDEGIKELQKRIKQGSNKNDLIGFLVGNKKGSMQTTRLALIEKSPVKKKCPSTSITKSRKPTSRCLRQEPKNQSLLSFENQEPVLSENQDFFPSENQDFFPSENERFFHSENERFFHSENERFFHSENERFFHSENERFFHSENERFFHSENERFFHSENLDFFPFYPPGS